MISWLKWKPVKNQPYLDVYPEMPFTQQMTVPREVSLHTTDEGLRLFLNPVEELKMLRGKGASWRNLALNASDNPLASVEGNAFDLELTLAPGDAERIVLDIRGVPLTIEVQMQVIRIG